MCFIIQGDEILKEIHWGCTNYVGELHVTRGERVKTT